MIESKLRSMKNVYPFKEIVQEPLFKLKRFEINRRAQLLFKNPEQQRLYQKAMEAATIVSMKKSYPHCDKAWIFPHIDLANKIINEETTKVGIFPNVSRVGKTKLQKIIFALGYALKGASKKPKSNSAVAEFKQIPQNLSPSKAKTEMDAFRQQLGSMVKTYYKRLKEEIKMLG